MTKQQLVNAGLHVRTMGSYLVSRCALQAGGRPVGCAEGSWQGLVSETRRLREQVDPTHLGAAGGL
jgi:hypothetical protein